MGVSSQLNRLSCFYITCFVFDCVYSVNAGRVSIWRTTGRRVWMLTNAPPPSRAASAASTRTAPTSACVWTVTKPWSATLMCARLCQVSQGGSSLHLQDIRVPLPLSCPLTLRVPHFSWRAFSHHGRPPRDPEAECGWFKLHHLETGRKFKCSHDVIYLYSSASISFFS